MNCEKSVELTVLVIDDQAAMRKIVRSVLRETGIVNVTTAENGSVAFEKLTDPDLEFPDVIVCDLHMDEMSGTEFVHKLRRSKYVKNTDVPVIVLTGESREMVLEVTRQVGADAILRKPVSAEEMREMIESVVGFRLDMHKPCGAASPLQMVS